MKLFVNEREEIAYLNTLEYIKICLENIFNNSVFLKNGNFKKEYDDMMMAINDLLKPIHQNYSSLFHYIKVEHGNYYLNYDVKINEKYMPIHFILTNNGKDMYFIKEIDGFNNILIKRFRKIGKNIEEKNWPAKLLDDRVYLTNGFSKDGKIINQKVKKIMNNL